MKNKHIACIIVLLVAALVCLTACMQSTTRDKQDIISEVQNKVDNVHFEPTLKDEENQEQCVNYASIQEESEFFSLPALAGDIAQVLPMDSGAVAVLYTDGTVGVAGNDMLAAKVSSWKNVIQLYLGTDQRHLVAKMADGTAVSTEYDLSGWYNLKEMYICWEGIAGLTEDGQIVTVGEWNSGNPDGWTEIRDFFLGGFACLGIKNDGSIVCTEESFYKEICSLKNVRQLIFSNGTYAILEDGRIVSDSYDESELEALQGAVKFMGDGGWLFGLSADGCLLARTGDGWVYNNGDYFTNMQRGNEEENPNIHLGDIRFQNIKDIFYQNALIMLKYDGTVDTINVDYYWDLSTWGNVEKVTTAYADESGNPRIYGIRGDGSVIVADAGYQQKSISMENYLGWRVLDLYSGQNMLWSQAGVVGITPEGTLVGDGDYADTDFSTLIR